MLNETSHCNKGIDKTHALYFLEAEEPILRIVKYSAFTDFHTLQLSIYAQIDTVTTLKWPIIS